MAIHFYFRPIYLPSTSHLSSQSPALPASKSRATSEMFQNIFGRNYLTTMKSRYCRYWYFTSINWLLFCYNDSRQRPDRWIIRSIFTFTHFLRYVLPLVRYALYICSCSVFFSFSSRSSISDLSCWIYACLGQELFMGYLRNYQLSIDDFRLEHLETKQDSPYSIPPSN